jgi:nicotinic acid phosphoribosyltransferase
MFDLLNYKNTLREFPQITYAEFKEIEDDDIRLEIAKRNKIVSTDAYNRTMTYIKNEKSYEPENYTLTFRKSNNGEYLVANGIRFIVKSLLQTPITHWEVDFARDFYQDQKEKGGNGYFNEALWRSIVTDHNGFLPVTIRAVPDGTVLLPGEPAICVKSQIGEIAAHLEPVLLSAFYETAVTTDFVHLCKKIGKNRIVEAGKRASVNEPAHIRALHALEIAGLKVTSNDTAALANPRLLSGGTTAHRFFACYDTELEAMEAAIQRCDKVTLLVDLIDPYNGIQKIIGLKEKYRNQGKTIYMRLDSGNLIEQAIHALKEQKKAGMTDPAQDKISIADVSGPEDIFAVETAITDAGFNPQEFITYVTGEMLVMKNKTRNCMSAAYKLTECNGKFTGKLAGGIGKEAIPGELNIEITDTTRTTLLENEPVKGKRLLEKVYCHGKFFFEPSDVKAAENAKAQIETTFPYKELKAQRSQAVDNALLEVRKRFERQIC